MKINGAILQDLYHYSLAMQGRESGFPSHTLMARLDAAAGARRVLVELEGRVSVQWDRFIKGDYESEVELDDNGRELNQHVCKVAEGMGIDPNSGYKIKAGEIFVAPTTKITKDDRIRGALSEMNKAMDHYVNGKIHNTPLWSSIHAAINQCTEALAK